MEIKFSKESYDDLDEIEDYLLHKWNDKVLEDFNLKLNHCLDLILDGIVVFQKYENTDFHKIFITKHNTLIYIMKNNVLKIIRILQNFQDPEENYKQLSED